MSTRGSSGQHRRDRASRVEEGFVAVDDLILRVQTSSRRKRFALTVEADADLTLHAPEGYAPDAAEDFVRAHRAWLVEKRVDRERNRPVDPAKRLMDGELFRYLGRTYRLVVAAEVPKEGKIHLSAGRLVMSQELAQEVALGRAAMIDWYCQAGRSWVRGRLQPWAARMSIAEPEIHVADLGNRWGTYRSGTTPQTPGRITLGWPLFQLPMHLVNYVIAHELAHAKVSDHGPAFWRLLGRALPEYGQHRLELDELGRRMWMGRIT